MAAEANAYLASEYDRAYSWFGKCSCILSLACYAENDTVRRVYV